MGNLSQPVQNLGANNPELRQLRARSEELRGALAAEVKHLVQGAQNEAEIASTTSANLATALEASQAGGRAWRR